MNHFLPTSPEQRQHICLSKYAFEVLTNDSLIFEEKINISGFINTIINNVGMHHFDATRLSEKERIEKLLQENNVKTSENDLNLVEKIADSYIHNFIEENSSYPKEISLKIRLRNSLYHELYPDNGIWVGTKYHTKQGVYIKAVLEEYARRRFYDRESIFFKSIIKSINDHILSENAKQSILPIILVDGTKLYVKPLRISKDYEAPYHYLIGLSSKNPEKDYMPSSTRISKIKEVKPGLSSYISGKITNKERSNLEQRIAKNKVPYIIGETQSFRIHLSTIGVKMYNSIYHQRPMYNDLKKNTDGSVIIEITATERQITNYFFQFGKEAYIVSPLESKDDLKKRFKEAYESYNSDF